MICFVICTGCRIGVRECRRRAAEQAPPISTAGRAGPSLGSGSHIEAHRSGPSSQLSGPIAGFLACVEDAQRLRLPSSPSPRRGSTGLHRTQFRNPNRKSRKREKGKRSEAECFFCCANLVARESYSQFV